MDIDAEKRFSAWAATRVASLHRTAFLLCGDWHVAEDLVQEALSRTALHWRRIERIDQPDAYVRRILVNASSQRWRRRSNHEQPTGRVPDLGQSDGTEARALRDELMTALAELPSGRRAAVVLRYFEELSEAETADALNCSIGTVKSQTSRALASLRRTLATQELPC
jgi:RNA polymerase sigma-70 factor (sigma-E family)